MHHNKNTIINQVTVKPNFLQNKEKQYKISPRLFEVFFCSKRT